MKVIDLAGQRIGRWTVRERAPRPERPLDYAYQYSAWWLCECACGTEKVLCGKALRGGVTKSCGCLKLEQLRAPRRNKAQFQQA